LKVKKEPSSQKEHPPSPRTADLKTLDVVGMAWVDKHKPTSIKEIVGQAGAASNVTK